MDLTKKCARCGFALGHHSAGNESFCPEKVKGECRFSKNKFEPRGEQGEKHNEKQVRKIRDGY